MPGSFHLSFFVFRHFWRRIYQNQLSFSGKDSTADFSFFVIYEKRKWDEMLIRHSKANINSQYEEFHSLVQIEVQNVKS